ncbi:FMN-dependent NADH-azoreductase [Sphingomonas oligoaromativorans]|jgi:FMN-dependent NADH-azoreductase|uniref:FMN-dependent NADH-azoreductase n=1 Tax=Sphingomonas oligoaromativorans TaxID=575322 RepID=UPI001422B684|nr:NAD(P)H-dependent oxidoreductase [Sphingomonas oligoaromativorans]NIJ35339.1 FMN-dependent NADH-azoreductase [Sphingomonas oligoaromativorans]
MQHAPEKPEDGQVKQILYLTCSPRGRAGESSKLSRIIVDCLLEREPMTQVVERVIGGNALQHVDGDYALSQALAEDVSQEGSMIRSEELIRELESADYLVIGTPVHNFTVPSTLKAWLDHVVRVRRTFDVSRDGKIPLLHDRPVFVGVSSGGRISGTRTRQPDFLTPYLRAVLGIIGLQDMRFFSIEGTAAGPDATALAQRETGRAIREHFASLA